MTDTAMLDLAALSEYFTSRDDVSFALLFGSHARGQAGPLADVDVAAYLSGSPSADQCFDARLDITLGGMGVLGVNDVDVAILNCVGLVLRFAVIRDGVLLSCRDRRALVEFRARTMTEYFDYLPVLTRHTRAILDHARRGELLSGRDRHRRSLERDRRSRRSPEAETTAQLR